MPWIKKASFIIDFYAKFPYWTRKLNIHNNTSCILNGNKQSIHSYYAAYTKMLTPKSCSLNYYKVRFNLVFRITKFLYLDFIFLLKNIFLKRYTQQQIFPFRQITESSRWNLFLNLSMVLFLISFRINGYLIQKVYFTEK